MTGKTTLIENARLVFPGCAIQTGSLAMRGGTITFVGDAGERPPEWDEGIDADGSLLTPGLIDLHTHGIERFRYDGGPEEVLEATSCLAKYGCTSVLPTLLGRRDAEFVEYVSAVSRVLSDVSSVAVPGLHVEGPFMARTGVACPTVAGDVGFVRELLAAGEGRVRVMSLSPEVAGIVPVIELLVGAGVLPFITHTGASVAETQRALDAGACHATHFYDVFYAPPETDLGVRPVGCVEAILADRRATVDFICDGVHVDPVAVRMGLLCKGWQNVVLITDSNIGAGLPAGEYDTPWGFRIRVRPEEAARVLPPHELAGALAGSALTMNRGMANLHAWFGEEYASEQLWALATSNPARLIGQASKGVLQVGADADLVLWGEDFEPIVTWVGGRRVYG